MRINLLHDDLALNLLDLRVAIVQGIRLLLRQLHFRGQHVIGCAEIFSLDIKHIVTQASIDGKKVLVQADRAKTKSSLRTLPLVPPIRDRLLMLKGQQDTYRRLCGKSYNRDYLGYLCVDEIGNIIRPNYVSEQFPKLLEKNGLRPIRFHDLRHSCASLLLANGVPMKQIQEWLGHSDFSTTANIYAHLDYASKLSSAQAMLEGLGYGNASA